WWEWRGTDQEAGSSDMSPKGKLAEQFLTKWWAQGWRPEAAPGAGGTRPGSSGQKPGGSTSSAGVVRGSTFSSPGGTAAAAGTGQTAATGPDGSDAGNVAGSAKTAAPGARSVARLPGIPGGRALPVAVATMGVLGAGLAVGN